MGITDWVSGLFNDPPAAQAKSYAPDPVDHYPTTDDSAFAKQNDWSYGQPYAPYFNGQRSTYVTSYPFNDPNFKTYSQAGNKGLPEDYYARGALAANRSALATLGFEPTKVGVDVFHDPMKSEVPLGLTYRDSGQMYANAGNPSTIVHESIHNGVNKLVNSPYWKDDFNQLRQGLPNELMVRHLMKTKMGDPERVYDNIPMPPGFKNAGMEQRRTSDASYKADPKWQSLTDQMEAAAAQYLAHKKPMGPR